MVCCLSFFIGIILLLFIFSVCFIFQPKFPAPTHDEDGSIVFDKPTRKNTFFIKQPSTREYNLYVKQNKNLYVKTVYGYVDGGYYLSEKGGGSASGQSSGNPSSSNSLPVKSKPNSKSVRYSNGEKIQERYYDENGEAKMDVDYTNHGNPKRHPKVPHRHRWVNGRRMKTDE